MWIDKIHRIKCMCNLSYSISLVYLHILRHIYEFASYVAVIWTKYKEKKVSYTLK